MEILKTVFLIFFGFSSGVVISGAVFAFIAMIGVVPRLAQKTRKTDKVKLFEEAIIWGGIFGTSTMIFDYYLPIGALAVIIISFCIGIFYGMLAVSLAETLDVVPILMRRGRLKKGLKYLIFSIAFGKLFGSLMYYFIPGFYVN